jgi:ribonuclease HI
MSKQITIYTDGSCNNKFDNRKGGWGVVMLFNGETITMSGREENTSSNRMEMTAILAALCRLNKSKLRVDEVLVRADSQYAINIFNGKWNASSNLDLLEDFKTVHNALLGKGTKVRFEWVRGHAGNQYNEMADQLANYKITKEVICPTTTLITSSS